MADRNQATPSTADAAGVELDDEVDEELDDAALASATSTTDPTPAQLAGGAPRPFAALLGVLGAIGTLASALLTFDYVRVLSDPSYVPACDLNPLVGCGQFLGSDQSWAFGFPNVFIGLIAFPVVAATGAALLAGARLARWYWLALLAGTVFGAGFITWLQWQSFFTIRGLCPYCMVVWTVTIPIFVQTLVRSVQAGHLRTSAAVRSVLVANRWLIVALWYAALVLAIAVVFRESWIALV